MTAELPAPSYTEMTEKSVPPVNSTTLGERHEETVSTNYSASTPLIPAAKGVQDTCVQKFDRNPAHCTCPSCHSIVMTHTKQKNGLVAWLACAILLLFGCWLGCCLIPFCLSDLKNVQHYCPNCNALIGEFRMV